jgi:two-component system KDP operon response regulator KdpE
MAVKVLLIDDDLIVLQLLKLFLEKEGYRVLVAQSAMQGLEIANRELPDIAILDVVMPVMDGFEACRRLRELGLQSILMMSNRHDERSIVRALELGADDYVCKPFDLPVLLAKMRTLLRRNGHEAPGASVVYDDGRLLIDLEKRRVEVEGDPIQLTPTEFRLLATLLRNVGRVVSHEELIREVWGMEESASLASLKVYVHYLRRKIEEHPRKPYYLLAEWGIGYRLREPKASL